MKQFPASACDETYRTKESKEKIEDLNNVAIPHSPLMVLEPLIRDPGKAPSMDELHLLIMSMDDELSGYRWREAIWLSIIAHVVVFLAAWFAPQWLPKEVYLKPVLRKSNQDTTFMVMPNDRLPPRPTPKTNIISDKNRIAQARLPNREALRRLNYTQPPGTPPPPAQPPPAQPAPPQTANPTQPRRRC